MEGTPSCCLWTVKIPKGINIDLDAFDCHVASLDAALLRDLASLVGPSLGQNNIGTSRSWMQIGTGHSENSLDDTMATFPVGHFMGPHQSFDANQGDHSNFSLLSSKSTI
ncbi:hypothetical protein E6O75_ATG08013 [Venturia nashicola]|uniref:Uncharacterized protein n=1 Tax=Venturia nashicola TaxID=86259 RepID=A0A4Z1NJG0_9PEZI|nr:hypothetical protein E6O75_ATG08013 [Venturia nashicola]